MKGSGKLGLLLLSGGGDFKKTLVINKYFVQIINKNKPLLYIPIAGNTEVRSYKSNLNYIHKIFNPLGINEIRMWTDVKGKTIDELNQFSAVYISGGNTISLLNDFKEAGFDKLLLQYYNNDGIIYGQSAGAIIFGKNVFHTSADKRHRDDWRGLSFVPNYSIWCHYSAQDDLLIKDFLNKDHQSYLLLPEGTATLINEENIIGIGEREPIIITLNKFGGVDMKQITCRANYRNSRNYDKL